MSAADTILQASIWIGLFLLAAAFLLTVWRVVQGPTLPDRVVALDMLVGIVIGFIALIAIRTGFTLYVDIAIALGLVGFLATVAFARFILSSAGDEAAAAPVGTAAAETAPQPRSKPQAKSRSGPKAKGMSAPEKKSADAGRKAAKSKEGKAGRPSTGKASKPSTSKAGKSAKPERDA
ncbi:multicomponent Na+:H+ antiporter subunit F [Neorhizobium sp. NCHU2750]|nr:multicomponent Na+:H+ antiporter subunit F [Neorhizobium sp. NCHU2750]